MESYPKRQKKKKIRLQVQRKSRETKMYKEERKEREIKYSKTISNKYQPNDFLLYEDNVVVQCTIIFVVRKLQIMVMMSDINWLSIWDEFSMQQIVKYWSFCYVTLVSFLMALFFLGYKAHDCVIMYRNEGRKEGMIQIQNPKAKKGCTQILAGWGKYMRSYWESSMTSAILE